MVQKKTKARFICALTISYLDKKIASVIGTIDGHISKNLKEKMVLGMINFYSKNYNKTFGEMKSSKKYKIDHRFMAF